MWHPQTSAADNPQHYAATAILVGTVEVKPHSMQIDLKKSKTVDINILLNRIKVDKNRANLNNLKKFSFWLSIICITGLLIII